MQPITEREHAELINRVGRVELRVDRVDERVDEVKARMDRLDGMATMLRLIFGASVIGAVSGTIALLELVAHTLGA